MGEMKETVGIVENEQEPPVPSTQTVPQPPSEAMASHPPPPPPPPQKESVETAVVANSTVDDTTVTTSLGDSKREYASGVDGMMEEYSVR